MPESTPRRFFLFVVPATGTPLSRDNPKSTIPYSVTLDWAQTGLESTAQTAAATPALFIKQLLGCMVKGNAKPEEDGRRT